MSKPINITADAHIWGAASAFSQLNGVDSHLTLLENNQINREALTSSDILLTRSSTKVNAALLDGTPVRFAATATIGDDHYDRAWLDEHQIAWANAAGSSTGAVLEYIAALLLHLHQQQLISIPDTTIGIIGAGRIGGALAKVCESIGMNVLLNDPPRARSEGKEAFSTLDEVLEQADLITLHTPMITSGEDSTFHLIDRVRLSQFRGRGIINAARGGCVDNLALKQWLDSDSGHFAALDCWEHEPSPLQELIEHPQLVVATPHIAGHSLDGKAANTLYIYRALCQFLNIEPAWSMQSELPPLPAPITIEHKDDPWHTLHDTASQLYPLLHDHNMMKSWASLSEAQTSNAFRAYRRHYPERRAWHLSPVRFSSADSSLLQLAHALGIKTV